MDRHTLVERASAHATAAAARLNLPLSDGPDDDDEAPGSGAEVGTPLPGVVWIEYENADGDESSRNLTLREIWRENGTIRLRGWCHYRRMIRTFRADRIVSLVCLSTGEAPDDIKGWLADHALFAGDHEADFTPHALRLCRDELAVLAFMARADGVLDPDEIEIAVDFVMMSTEKPVDRDRAAAFVRRLSPDYGDMRDSISRLAKSPRERWPKLARTMRRLMDADGMLHHGEQSAWSEIEQAFSSDKDAHDRALEAKALAEIEASLAQGVGVRFGIDAASMRDLIEGLGQ